MSNVVLGRLLVIFDTLWPTFSMVFVWMVELVGSGSEKCGYFVGNQSSEGTSRPRDLDILHSTSSISLGGGSEKVLPFE